LENSSIASISSVTINPFVPFSTISIFYNIEIRKGCSIR